MKGNNRKCHKIGEKRLATWLRDCRSNIRYLTTLFPVTLKRGKGFVSELRVLLGDGGVPIASTGEGNLKDCPSKGRMLKLRSLLVVLILQLSWKGT